MRRSLLLALPLLAGCVYAPLDLGLGQLGQIFEAEVVEGSSDQKLLLLRISGEISGEDGSGLLGSGPATTSVVRQELDLARKDDAIKGILLRIDSPGGGVTASDLIHHELLRWKQETGKPIVAWLGDTAASGGYYVAQAADLVLASPTCITGSIGVIATFPDASGLGEKIGVSVQTIKSGANKDIGSLFRPMQPAERELLQQLIDGMYQRFLDVVVAGRARAGLTREALLPLADGRVFTAAEAQTQRLIDGQGYFEDALRELAQRAGADGAQVVVYERRSLGGSHPTIYAQGTPGVQLRLGEGGLVELADRVLPRSGPAFRYQWLPGRE